MVLLLRLPVLCRDSDAEQGIAAARTKILAVDAVGSSFGHLRCERHGGDFERHRQAVLVNVRVKGRGEGAAGGRQGEEGSVAAEFRLFFLLFFAAVYRDGIHLARLAVGGCDRDFKVCIAAASAQVLPVNAVGGTCGGFGGEGHGGDFERHRQIVLVNLRLESRVEGAAGRRQREKGSVSAELWFFFFLFLAAVDGDLIFTLCLAVLRRDGDFKDCIAAARP